MFIDVCNWGLHVVYVQVINPDLRLVYLSYWRIWVNFTRFRQLITYIICIGMFILNLELIPCYLAANIIFSCRYLTNLPGKKSGSLFPVMVCMFTTL